MATKTRHTPPRTLTLREPEFWTLYNTLVGAATYMESDPATTRHNLEIIARNLKEVFETEGR